MKQTNQLLGIPHDYESLHIFPITDYIVPLICPIDFYISIAITMVIPIYAIDQWEFQEPKLEVPTIYKAYS